MITTVKSSGLKGYLPLMNSFSINAKQLLRKYGIDEIDLHKTDALLSLHSVVDLLEESALICNCKSFGLQLSKYQSIDILGPISLVMQNAKTVNEALQLGAKYLFTHSSGIELTIFKESSLIPGAVEISLDVVLNTSVKNQQCLELCIADLHNIIKLIAGDAYRPIMIAFPHSKISDDYKDYFNCKLTFEHNRAGIHIMPNTLNVALKSTNQTYLQVAETYIKNNYGLKEEPMNFKVRRLLSQLLGTNQANKEYISNLIAIHPRTLQRKLRKEGTSFEEIKDVVRKKAMLKYLKQTDVPLNQLAEILGFSEQSVMSRASKRWFGVSPSKLRKKNS